jgi:Zn-dependent M28 family amino/carboxypeptidase
VSPNEKIVNFPIFILNEKISAKVFGIKKNVLSQFLDSVQSLKMPTRILKVRNIKVFAHPNNEEFKTSNIIGAMPGTDLKAEAIVVSAHFDHLGTSENGTIYNGANDNASGTSTLLEMLRILNKMRKEGFKPRRTIIFAAFTAEEKGLWGSRFYTDHPLFPLENTKFDVNIDMVGVYGWKNKDKPIKFAIVEDENPVFRTQQANLIKNYNLNLEIDYIFSNKNHPDNLFYRSDHYNFAKKGIPIAFFNCMKDKNYHKPTDDIKFIESDAMQEVAKLILATIWTEANKN